MLGRKYVSACKAAIYISEIQFEPKKRMIKTMKDQHQLESVLCECTNSNYNQTRNIHCFSLSQKKCFGFAIHV